MKKIEKGSREWKEIFMSLQPNVPVLVGVDNLWGARDALKKLSQEHRIKYMTKTWDREHNVFVVLENKHYEHQTIHLNAENGWSKSIRELPIMTRAMYRADDRDSVRRVIYDLSRNHGIKYVTKQWDRDYYVLIILEEWQ